MSTTNRPTIKAEAAPDEALGQTLGRYKLLEKIGEGGFGVVYVAEQKEPVKRRVALKVIKLGMDTRQVVARFEAERQALALTPNIAKVLDAGATDLGRPYFVMELVRGVRLTDYCDQHKLSTKQRLELFLPVCQAIQHAHQKGIIHRDIKPSNILVTLHDGVPVPKVIDFGIAKATQQDLTDKTVYTQLQQFVGTPAYMSPEQAEMSGLDVDTRSDIYSLGVLLYELLTGRTPFDARELMAQGIDVMRKTIREKEPVRPSTKVATLEGEELSTTAARRAAEAPKLISLLRGDLDWIVMRCLEKDRTRRYETANGVAMDLRRHLNNEMVLARPPSAAYRLQKAFRRNKLVFAAGAAVIAALILGVAGTTVGLIHARRAQVLALKSRGDAEKLSNFMLDDLFEQLEPTGDYETISRLAAQAVAYYDGLPALLHTPETERNRATARARLAFVSAKQGKATTAVPLSSESFAWLDKARRHGDSSEATLLGLVLAMEARLGCFYAKLENPTGVAQIQENMDAIRPYVASQTSSRRIKLEFAALLDAFSHVQEPEEGLPTSQEALRILEGMGALSLHDLTAASVWADIADSQARGYFWTGRMDDAERLERQVETVVEGVLARRPGDLHARLDRSFAPNLLGYIEARRFHDAAALELARRSREAEVDYLRFNPFDRNCWLYLGNSDFIIASLLFRSGRVTNALQAARRAIEEDRDSRSSFEMFSDVGSVWPLIAVWEAQRGNREAASRALDEGKRSVNNYARQMRLADANMEQHLQVVEDAARQVKLAFAENAETLSLATEVLPVLEKARTRSDTRDMGLFLIWQVIEEATRASLNLGRFVEAEVSARRLVSLPPPTNERVEMLSIARPWDVMWSRVLLARAQLGQGFSAEALQTLQTALDQYRSMQLQGATHLSYRQHFACALYVQALAQSMDVSGTANRRDSLDQAARLLNELSDEARQLYDTKELLSWISAEQGKLRTDASGP